MIKDLVLKSFFTRFTESWNIAYNDTISEAKAFEKFVNHTILSLDDNLKKKQILIVLNLILLVSVHKIFSQNHAYLKVKH